MARITSLERFLEAWRPKLLYQCISGSRAYNLATEQSDEDVRGVVIEPSSAYFGFSPPPPQHADAKSDIVFYTLHRFLELVVNANPNLLELLFMPQDCVRFQSPLIEPLLEQRQAFVTQQAYHSLAGYAYSQVKRAKGQNKWVNNPQPKAAPLREEFCWIIPRESDAGAQPYRPIALAESGVDLARCVVSKVEHAEGLYRLYELGQGAAGVFRGGALVSESIPADQEQERCIGLLLFNERRFERAQKDHRHYWKWREDRNDQRWLTQERGEIDYDAKNLMHTFRLLFSCEHILRHGVPRVRFEGEQREFLMRVRQGAFLYEELEQLAEAKRSELAALFENCALPDDPPLALAEALLREITSAWQAKQ